VGIGHFGSFYTNVYQFLNEAMYIDSVEEGKKKIIEGKKNMGLSKK